MVTQTTWTNGDSSASQTLLGADHLYPVLFNELRTAVNTLESHSVRTATKVVATAEPADYICDGTADDVQIQAAFNSGGRIFIRSGTYNLAAAVTIPSNTIIIGEGINKTIITQPNSTGLNRLFRNATQTGAGNTNITIKDLTIDANGSGTGNSGNDALPLYFMRVTNFLIERVETTDGNLDSIGITQSSNGIVTKCINHDTNNNSEGIGIATGTTADNVETQNIIVSQNICYSTDEYGISAHQPSVNHMTPKNITIIGNTVYNVGGDNKRGINLSGATGCTVANNIAYGNLHGIYITDGYTANNCAYNTVIGNICKNQTGTGAAGIYLAASYYNSIIGNILIDDQVSATQKYGLTAVSDNHHQIIGNITLGNTLYDYNLAVGTGITNIYDFDGTYVIS